jgi:subtilisin family serine protease
VVSFIFTVHTILKTNILYMFTNFKKSVLCTIAIGYGFAAMAQKSVPQGWHLMDKSRDGYYGISLDKAYDQVKGKKSQTVIVAVIDSGIDTTHEDLKPVLWVNAKEIPGNGIDDDGNGYIDDVHGWNFLGGKDGRNVTEDSYEVHRVYHKYKAKYATVNNASSLPKEEQEVYTMWKKAEKQVLSNEGGMGAVEILLLKRTYDAAMKSDSILQKAMGKTTFTGKELDAYLPTTDEAKKAKSSFLFFFKANDMMESTNTAFLGDLKQYLAGEEKKAEAVNKAPKNYRGDIVQDKYNDINDRFYGNNNLMVDLNGAKHGTHVSGIIAAARNNGIGVDGVADNVRIMTLRAVPDGDEHDKDIALAIRYAVDNGAKIINMSFGKGFSPEKHWVDDAVKYAESKGVLLVHAAGNDAANIDSVENFPTPIFKEAGKRASNWITVGASGDTKGGGIVAPFSNYGKKEVDVFAPGMFIYATVPGGNTYDNLQGTSMASPVVAGTAAFLLSYYPNLTAQQLKYVIENSAVKSVGKVMHPGNGNTTALSDLSKTGGLLNAFEAVKLAQKISGEGNNGKPAKVVKQNKASKKPTTTEKKTPVKAF